MHILLDNPKALWHHLFDNSVVGIALVDSNGKFVKVNPKLQEILGYTDYELNRLTFQDITLPSDIEADEEAVADIKAGKIPTYSMRKRYITKDGKVVWIRLTVHPHFPANLEPETRGITDIYFISQIEEISSTETKLEKLVEKQSEIIEHYTTEVINVLATIQNFIEDQKAVKSNNILTFLDRHAQWIVPTLIGIVVSAFIWARSEIIKSYERDTIIQTVVERMEQLDKP